MCDGCFWSQFDPECRDDGLDLATYLATLVSDQRAAIDAMYAELHPLHEAGGHWIGGYFNGALHGAIDDDNYNDSYRRAEPRPGKTEFYAFTQEETATLDRWDALDEDQRAIVVGLLSEYPQLAEALGA